jgi:plastocyanin
MRKLLWPLGLVLMLLAGCASQPAAQPSSAPVTTNVVDLPPSYQFVPAHITVSAGSTVTWTNHDNFTHSVQVDGQSDVHMLRPGQSAQITFTNPGAYHYVCTLHSQTMQGTVTVT